MNTNRIRYFTLYLSFLFILAACNGDTAVDSNRVATGDIFATFQVISDGNEDVHVEAQLTKGVPPSSSRNSETFVSLVGEDKLWFSSEKTLNEVDIQDDFFAGLKELNGTQTPILESKRQREYYIFLWWRAIISEFGTWYSGFLPQDDDGLYNIALIRPKHTSSYDTSVQLPASYSVVQPIVGERFSRASDTIIIEWTNTQIDMDVEIEVITRCAESETDTYSAFLAEDSGMHIIPAGELSQPFLQGECSTTINIRKITNGTLDSKFFGGVVNGYQVRRTVIATID